MLIPLGVLDFPTAAGGTYDLLETEILTGSQASVTFSSLNSTYGADYQHLQVRMTLRSNAAGSETGSPGIQFNGVGSSQYSSHYLTGNGTSVSSTAFTSQDYMFGYLSPAASATSGEFAGYVVDVLDPFETTKNTTIRALGGSSSGEIRLTSGAWNSTSALTSILIDNRDGQNWVSGSRFSLYGLKASA